MRRVNRSRHVFSTFVLLLGICLLAVGCVAPSINSPENSTGVSPTASNEAASNETDSADDVTSYDTWEEVLAAAKDTSVNWFAWGGSDTINSHIDVVVGEPLASDYGIQLNRIPIENTSDAVNKLLNEKAASVNSGGSIDLIWINGENFRTLKDADLLYGPFVTLLPNTQYVDWDNPTVANDFGTPVDGYESPWASFQFVMEFNTATVGDTPPRSYEALAAWIEANPGRFTYPAPPNHVGSAFVRQIFYWAAGSSDPFLGTFDQTVYNQYAPIVWEYLNRLKPNLWRGGSTYPELSAMADLLANQEIDFAMEYDASRASNFINQGRYPDSIRTFVFETGTVANVSYVAIPYNAANPAGALVVANFLLSPDYQIAMTDPDTLGWIPAVNPTHLPSDAQAKLEDAPRGAATLSAEELNSHTLPEMGADWVTEIDRGWEENVLR